MTREIDISDNGLPAEGPVLRFGEKRFRCQARIGARTLAAATDPESIQETNVAAIDRIARFLAARIEDESERARFLELYEEDVISQGPLLNAYARVIEYYAGRPTDVPSGSSPGSSTLRPAPTSTPVSSSPEAPGSTPSPATFGAF